MLNWILGKYIGFAFNDPKKYPNKPFLDNSTPIKKEMTDKEMEEMGRRNCLMLGGELNDS